MSAQRRTSEQEAPATDPDQSLEASANVDSDDDTEAHGGKIFVRKVSVADDGAERDSQPKA